MESNSEQNERIEEHLQKQKNDFIGALKTIPFKMLKLYVHSYQSFLFNKALEEYTSLNTGGNKLNYDEKIPIIGLSMELKELKNQHFLISIMFMKKYLLMIFLKILLTHTILRF